ncbi:hypothetical protein BGZ83_000125 [Gryganskiella cystojenkinii]|nr:hypothetical protein BGZ83_000125 [Gryganskiella cystojenkinii]
MEVPSTLRKRWHPEPPPVLQRQCLAVDKVNGRTFIIGYDSSNSLVFNYINSTEACDDDKKRTNRASSSDEQWHDDNLGKDDEAGFDWQHAHWTVLPHPAGAEENGHDDDGRRWFDTENCFLSSDAFFVIPSYDREGAEGVGNAGFSIWDHDHNSWSQIRIERPCSCHEQEIEEATGHVKIKQDERKLKFEYPNRFAVVYQSYRAARREGTGREKEEAIDSVVIHWKDMLERDHLTGIQLVNRQIYSCHDIKIGHSALPTNITLVASPNNPNHYTHHNTPKKYKQNGDHGSRCENTTLFLFGPEGSGWFDISIADRPSERPFDLMYPDENKNYESYAEKIGFHSLPNLEVEHPRSVYYGGQLWIFGKNDKGVGVWSIDVSDHEVTSASESKSGFTIAAQSQGGPSPGSIACASCGDGIIVYGSCDKSSDCSTTLKPGEESTSDGSAPVAIFRPGFENDDEDDDDDDDEDDNEDHEGEGEGGSNGGDHGSGGGTSVPGGGVIVGGGGAGSGGSGSSNGEGAGSGSGGSGGPGSEGSGGSGGSGSDGSGSSESGGSGSGGTGSGGSGGSGGAGSTGGGGSWSPASGFPPGVIPNGVPGAISPNSPYPNPDAQPSGQVMVGATATANLPGQGLPTNGGDNGGGSKVTDVLSHSRTGAILGGIFGAVAVIALVSLIFVLAKRQRRRQDAEALAADGGSAGPGDGIYDGAGSYGPDGIYAAPAGGTSEGVPKNPSASGGGATEMPGLTPLAAGGGAGSGGGAGLSEDGSYSPYGGMVESTAAAGSGATNGHGAGAVLGVAAAVAGAGIVAGTIADRHRRKEPIQLRPTPNSSNAEQVYGTGHSIHGDSSSESINQNPLLAAKRSSKAKFFMGGGDYGVPARRTSPSLPSPTAAVPPVPPLPANNNEPEVVEVVSREEHANGSMAASGGSSSSAAGDVAMIAGGMIIGAAGAAAISSAQHSSTSNDSSKLTSTTTTANDGATKTTKSTTTTTMTTSESRPGIGIIQGGETKEILHTSTSQEGLLLDEDMQGHSRFVSNASTGMVVSSDAGRSESSLALGGSTTSSSISSMTQSGGAQGGSSQTVINSGTKTTTTTTTTTTTSGGKSVVKNATSSSSSNGGHQQMLEGMVVVGAMTAGGKLVQNQQQQQQHQRIMVQQGRPMVSSTKTQITLKLSIIRYERSDADKATPHAKPGTLMFSQVEMIDSAKDIHIAGSQYSHVRDSSKITGHEDGLPSPVVPGPSGAGSSTESEPRERSLRWMKNEFQWKREAGMLQHLVSEKHIVELFTLYSLPPFAAYRYVSVMGPFTRTLDSYVKARKGIQQSGTPGDDVLAAQGALTLPELKSLTNSIASAVKWCHEHNVVHLNLSPSSIILQEVYSEPDGQGGYRASMYSSYSKRYSGDAADKQEPKVEQHWKLWNFSYARFIGESVDLGMETTAYSSPELLVAARRHRQKISRQNLAAEAENPNKDTTITTSVSSDGIVTRTMTTKSSSNSATSITSNSNGEASEKLTAVPTMDMWSLGQIVYELHTAHPMFASDEDALLKLGAMRKPHHDSDVLATQNFEEEEDEDDLDRAKTHDKIRLQLQQQKDKIEAIEDMGAREVITGLLEMQQERRLEHHEIRELYLDLPNE